MEGKNRIPARRSARLSAFDDASAGAYLVTARVRVGREPLSHVVGSRVELTPLGSIVLHGLRELADRFGGLRLDAKILMPDHLHAILLLSGSPHLPRDRRPTIPRVMQALTSITTIRINRLTKQEGEPYWKRSFHDRIVRDEQELWALRASIVQNPQRWTEKHR